MKNDLFTSIFCKKMINSDEEKNKEVTKLRNS